MIQQSRTVRISARTMTSSAAVLVVLGPAVDPTAATHISSYCCPQLKKLRALGAVVTRTAVTGDKKIFGSGSNAADDFWLPEQYFDLRHLGPTSRSERAYTQVISTWQLVPFSDVKHRLQVDFRKLVELSRKTALLLERTADTNSRGILTRGTRIS